MPHVDTLLIFLASPGDVPTERRIVEAVVADLNRTLVSDKNVKLQVVDWKNNTFPGHGQDAQALINAQIAEMSKYALFVGIMWNRLGTATPRAASGTVEEFERAVESSKINRQPNIWFYFRDSASKLDTEEQLEQRKKVLAFRQQLQVDGMPRTYKNPADFRKQFHTHLKLWLDRRTPLGSIKLTSKYEITGGKDALIMAVAEIIENLQRNQEPIKIYFQPYSEAKNALAALEEKGISTDKDREQRYALKKEMEYHSISILGDGAIPPDVYFADMVLTIIRYLYRNQSVKSLYSKEQVAECILPYLHKINKSNYGRDTHYQFEHNRRSWYFKLWLNESNEQIEELDLRSGVHLDYLHQWVLIQNVYPLLVSEYLRLKYCQGLSEPEVSEYFKLNEWTLESDKWN